MLNKIFLGVFAAVVIAMTVLIFYAHRQLQSIGFKPEAVAENFLYFDRINWNFLWFSGIALLLLASVVLWTTRRSWAMWLTLAYFAAFVIAESWWLGGLFSDYERQHNLTASGSYGNYIFGAVLCILAAIIVFFNQFLVLRLRERMYPTVSADTTPTEEALPDKEENA